jgi:hypothetical protein
VRKGLLAVPLYFVAVGIGHIALAVYWSASTTGLPRDGQAFSGTIVFGAGLVFLALLGTLVALRFERGVRAFIRGSLTAAVLAVTMVAYTASRGYLLGGLTDGPPCFVDPSGACAPPTGVTYIADAQPDVFTILLVGIAAYWISHIAARLMERRPIG